MQPEQLLQTHRHSMQHDKRVPRYGRAENCQQSDIPKHPGESGRPETVSKKDQAGVPKAAGWSVPIGQTPLRRQEVVAAGIRGCLLFLEGSVDDNKKRLL